MINSYALSAEAVLEALNSNEKGLTLIEVEKRLKENGLNTISEGKQKSLLRIFFDQFRSPLIYVLLVATLVSMYIGELSDGVIILFVLIFNASIGTFQESKAKSVMKALKHFSKGRAVTVRDGLEEEIDDALLTLGDIVVLRSGDKVPADARIINCQNLKTDESALTGESEPVEKENCILKEDTSMPDRRNMLYKSTLVVAGEALAVVTAVGKGTFIGSISTKLEAVDAEMPLQKKISDLSKIIGLSVFVALLLVFFVGLWRGLLLGQIIFTATAIAVSLIPEGLPVVITLILARGVYRMAKRNALVKNMQAVEALGQATVVAVDKTGTITKNELTVQKLYVDNKEFSISGSGFLPRGDIYLNDSIIESANHPEVLIAAKVATASSDASVAFRDDNTAEVHGDPTEAALVVFGEKVGFQRNELFNEEPIVFEEPFGYEHRFHSIVQKTREGFFMSVSGEPESILDRVSKIWTTHGERNIEKKDFEKIEIKIKEYAKNGLR
ncbi:MAG: HAD-IC family P-type ATPase, partial [Patescibacteria group bacterium]